MMHKLSTVALIRIFVDYLHLYMSDQRDFDAFAGKFHVLIFLEKLYQIPQHEDNTD
jgi:hypothetical protein